MLRITVQSSLGKAYDFIDNRLVLLMGEKKLRTSGAVGKSLMIDKKKVKENIQDSIFYLEKEPKRATMFIVTNERKGDKIRQHQFGVALREKNDTEYELYIDTLREAIKKGIISSEQLGNRAKIFAIIALIVAIALMFVLLPFAVIAFIIFIIGYPIFYLLEKKKFKHKQNIMHSLVSIFEAEFPTSNKQDSKDWIDFRMRVKSGVKDFVTP